MPLKFAAVSPDAATTAPLVGEAKVAAAQNRARFTAVAAQVDASAAALRQAQINLLSALQSSDVTLDDINNYVVQLQDFVEIYSILRADKRGGIAMAVENGTPLGRELLSALEAVNGLIPKAAASPQDLNNLRATRARLIEQIGTLVDTNLNRASQEYRAATSSLQGASASIHNAISGMESVAKAVETLAKTLDLVARLIAA